MAQKLRTFDFGRASALTSSEKATYPWSEWLDGDIWQLTEGEDFQTHPLMMERIIRTRATGRGAKVRLRHMPINGDTSPFGVIVLQRHDIAGPAERKRQEAREKRAAKKVAAEKEAQETLEKAGIKTTRKVAKPPSKRPVKKVVAKA